MTKIEKMHLPETERSVMETMSIAELIRMLPDISEDGRNDVLMIPGKVTITLSSGAATRLIDQALSRRDNRDRYRRRNSAN